MKFRSRAAPCSHCGDLVLVAEHEQLKLFGYRFGKEAVARVEHADPSPDGDVFDGVDDACRRRPVRR